MENLWLALWVGIVAFIWFATAVVAWWWLDLQQIRAESDVARTRRK